MKILFMGVSLLFLIIGCGSSNEKKDRNMKIGESYSVSKGDKIIKSSKDTRIRITHIEGESTSFISLLEGNASITHPKEK